jgi:hypothetical protein
MRSLRSQSLVIFTGYVLGAFALYWGLPEQVPPSWTVPSPRHILVGCPDGGISAADGGGRD